MSSAEYDKFGLRGKGLDAGAHRWRVVVCAQHLSGNLAHVFVTVIA
ncbi:MAG: hypothetical protein ACP5O0_00865 [Acidimicrobiales bacterium]